jgi:hypothetical protein
MASPRRRACGRSKPSKADYCRDSMANDWTPERLQAQLIDSWKPWLSSTGPRTEAGKAKVSRNGFKGGARDQLRHLARALRQQRQAIRAFG